MIEINDLTVHHGRNVAVDSVSIRIPHATSYALVGESGSGKTTLLRTVAGLNQAWTGRILLDGKPLPQKRSPALYRRIQMVFQDPHGSLHPRQTIDQALAEPLAVHRLDQPDRRIAEALAAVALPRAIRFRFPHQLSGGQRQRVAIARALISGPDLLLLDEPTSALDVSVQAEILNLLKDVQTRCGLTYLLVTHNLAVAAHLCPMIGVMQAGHMVEQLSAADLRDGRVAHPHTAKLRSLTVEHDSHSSHLNTSSTVFTQADPSS